MLPEHAAPTGGAPNAAPNAPIVRGFGFDNNLPARVSFFFVKKSKKKLKFSIKKAIFLIFSQKKLKKTDFLKILTFGEILS